ncbi:MAG: diacylglycerol kinase family protein [Bryobacteraceae bacterium]
MFNPSARGMSRQRPGFFQGIIHALTADGIAVSPAPTTAPGVATELARRALAENADLILAAGGDGTINEVVNGMAGSRVPLAILPGGTANVLAVELGVGSRMSRAARRVRQAVPERIALGRLHSEGSAPRYFLSMAGAGLDAQVVADVNPALKSAIGKGAYWVAGFSKLAQKLPQFDVEANGRTFRAGFALASRVRNYGGDLELAATASLMEPEFELVVFAGENPLRYLKYLGGAALGRIDGTAGVTVLRTREAEFRAADSTVLVQVDGELVGPLPARVEIVPDALTLLTPPDFRERIGLRAGQALAPA